VEKTERFLNIAPGDKYSYHLAINGNIITSVQTPIGPIHKPQRSLQKAVERN